MAEIEDKANYRNSKMSKSLPIVVIGQNYCTSLGIIKAFGEAGYRVEVGKRTMGKHRSFHTPEMKSRYVDRAIICMSVGSDNDMIKGIIQNFAVTDRKKILIPSDDFCVTLIDRNLDELSRHFILPHVKNEQGAVSRLMDKSKQKELAKKCGINVANSVIIKEFSNEAVNNISINISFPCFIKPVNSVGNPKSYIRKCENVSTLSTYIAQIAKEQKCIMLVEEFIDIEKEYTIPGIAIGKEVIIPAVLEKFQTGNGAHKGVTIAGKVHKSSAIGDCLCLLERFVKELDFQGIFDIELFKSKDKFYFNEINLRNGAAGYSLTKSGINLPAMYADYLIKQTERKSQEQFIPGRTFVNEKAALENYICGFCSFRTLIKTITTADIRFILTSNDINASIRFCFLSLYLIIKKHLGFTF